MKKLTAWPTRAFFVAWVLVLGAAMSPVGAQAQNKSWFSAPDFSGESHWRFVLSPYSLHWRPSDEHQTVYAIGAEQQYDNGWLYGGSYFRNSFGQPSGYLYLGKRYDNVWKDTPLFLQWSAGLLYGYRGKYENKVPFNHNGFSPGALVSVGWQFTRTSSVQLNALGDAGVMFQFSYDWR
ncbi:MAG: ABC transporter ATP-binding protein [Burkholderiaceae bacterium]